MTELCRAIFLEAEYQRINLGRGFFASRLTVARLTARDFDRTAIVRFVMFGATP